MRPHFASSDLGLAPYAAKKPLPSLEAGLAIARVIEQHKASYVIWDKAEFRAVVRGKFHREDEYPKVGDWITYSVSAPGQATIESILPRVNAVTRKESGGGESQTMAANVDLMCAVQGLDEDFNIRRLERYVLLARQSSATPLIILTKSDAATDAEEKLASVLMSIPGVDAVAISAKTGEGMEELWKRLVPGTTAVFVGSSGAGKSTLTNALLDSDMQRTGETREKDGKGRHTTRHRELFALPNGAVIIDTPGMRELGLLATDESAHEETFARIAELETQCQYRDCDHEKSEGCAVLAAIAEGTLEMGAYENYHRLLREREFEESRKDPDRFIAKKNEVKKIHKLYKKIQKGRRGGKI